jgi:hypothetical protein
MGDVSDGIRAVADARICGDSLLEPANPAAVDCHVWKTS